VSTSLTAQEVRGGHYIENGTRTSLFFESVTNVETIV
jgi:hypothetical protein